MRRDDEGARLAGPAASRGGSGLIGRLLSLVVAGVLLVLGLMFSALVFVALALVALLAGAWFWWKTRDLRRQLKVAEEAWRNAPAGAAEYDSAESGDGVVIEGEVVRVGDDEPELPPGRPGR